jgi:hypothetical protein
MVKIMNNFEEVSNDIIDLITNLHYDDKDKELIKFQIAYILFKMLKNEQTFEEDIKVLDDNVKRKK